MKRTTAKLRMALVAALILTWSSTLTAAEPGYWGVFCASSGYDGWQVEAGRAKVIRDGETIKIYIYNLSTDTQDGPQKPTDTLYETLEGTISTNGDIHATNTFIDTDANPRKISGHVYVQDSVETIEFVEPDLVIGLTHRVTQK